MLSAEQIAVIDKIPDEGKAPFLLPDETRAVLAQRPMEGLRPSVSGEATAKILIGAPGSGKSMHAFKALENEAYISYDEGGAIWDIPDYIDNLIDIEPEMKNEWAAVPRESVAARRELWLKYQNDSQNIRAQTLKGALKREFSIVVDTTSSSIGTKFLIAALRQLPYKEISMDGMFAPFAISRERIESRPRPTSGLGDLVGKRIGALEWIPEYATLTDKFNLSYNSVNGSKPELALNIVNGKAVSGDEGVIFDISYSLQSDTKVIRDYLSEIKQNPELVAPEDISALDIDNMMDRYQDAARKMTAFLKDMRP